MPTTRGGQWETGTVRDILLKPRNAGLIIRRPDGSYFDPESVVIEWKR